MKEQEIYNFEKNLASLRKVEAPEFLLTRIKARIQDEQRDLLSGTWALTLAMSFMLVLAINVIAFHANEKQNSKEHNLVEEMNLNTDNYLY